MSDMVNHPEHYQMANGLETFDIIESVCAELTGIEAVCAGNVIKYVSRFKKKWFRGFKEGRVVSA